MKRTNKCVKVVVLKMMKKNYCLILVFLNFFNSIGSSPVNGIFASRSLVPSIGFNPALVDSVAKGAQVAMNYCQNMFKWDKWNCPESAFIRRHKSQPATREIAFVHAILAAGIVHTVTRNCSRGNTYPSTSSLCGCNPNFRNGSASVPKGRDAKMLKESTSSSSVEWRWGGCSDHVEYGEEISRILLDGSEKGKDVNAHIHLHNNQVGRMVVRESIIKKCRCHGVSGSCSMQTCWMQLAPFGEIATKLRKKYERAQKLDYEGAIGNTAGASQIAQRILSDKPNRMIFIKKSPNYCRPNNSTGWKGTMGRTCSKTKSGIASKMEKKSCRNLCNSCGHRVRKLKKETYKRCNCTFVWCCEVKCDLCKETTEEYFCY